MDEYVKRLQFLKELWPEEHLSLLGPRAALLAEGAAFQKVSRIAPDKSPDGVKILAEQLGGTWGRLQVEDKFHYFEQAIYQTQQKHDETNDSYIARHDAQFEELLSRKVQLEETRAYILLRHSQLAPEDKKRVIVESKGDLKYAETIKAIKLLGSHFFGERQNRNGSSAGTSRGQERNKVYDVNMTEADDSEEINMATYDEEVDEDEAFAYFFEQCDQDALYIAEFEDGIIEAVQDSNLAPVFFGLPRSPSPLPRESAVKGLLARREGQWQAVAGQELWQERWWFRQGQASEDASRKDLDLDAPLARGGWTLEKGMSKEPGQPEWQPQGRSVPPCDPRRQERGGQRRFRPGISPGPAGGRHHVHG